jgi:hypothetical protein
MELQQEKKAVVPAASDDQKAIVAELRALLRAEIAQGHEGAKRVMGLNSQYVLKPRQVRYHREETEAKPLSFGGNHYAIIYVQDVSVLVGNEKHSLTRHAVEEAWNAVLEKHLEGDALVIEGTVHKILEPQITEDGKIVFGFTGVKYPQLPPVPSAH